MIAKNWWSTGLPGLFGLLLFLLSLCFSTNHQDVVLNAMIILLGLLAGWLVGIIISPYDVQERGDFSVYSKAVSVFVSGYLVAKSDALVTRLFSQQTFTDQTEVFRFLLAMTAFIGSIVITFTYRRYLADLPAAARLQAKKVGEASGGKLSFGMTEERALAALQGESTNRQEVGMNSANFSIDVGQLRLTFRYAMLECVERLPPTLPPNDG